MSSFLRDLPAWPSGKKLPVNGLLLLYDSETDQEYKLTPDQLEPGSSEPIETDSDFVPIAATTSHPAFTTQDAVNRWLLARNPTVIEQVQAPKAPAAPTNGRADDTADTFAGNINPLFAGLGDYEIYYPGSNGNQPATNGRADLVAGVLTIRGLTGLVGPNAVGMRVAANGNRPESAWLTNRVGFTGVVVVTPPTSTNRAPTVNLTGSSSTANTGQSVTLTAEPHDLDGDNTLVKTEYFDGVAKIGETTAAPWAILTPGLSQGRHDFTARTTDNKGATGTSTIFSVAVSTVQTVYNGSYTARCGVDKAGTGQDVYRTAQGASQAEADASARNAAIAALVCNVATTYTGNYVPTAQDITAACGTAGGTGQLTTRTSTQSQEAADQAAKNAALAAIVCSVPVNYNTALTASNPFSNGGVSFPATGIAKLRFNDLPNASGPTVSVVFIAAGVTIYADYPSEFGGQQFEFTDNAGAVRTGAFPTFNTTLAY